jgi:molecular chaperone GrpE
MPKNKKLEELEQQNGELVADLQRMRADFENYRKMVEQEKLTARENGQTAAVLKLLPVVDTIERAILHIPADIAEHPWVKGVGGLIKQLDGALASMNLRRIEAKPGTQFDPELHQAIKFDEDAEGENEVIAKELQAGYLLNGRPVRHAMVEVTRK